MIDFDIDPSLRLTAAYEAIHGTRMRDMPLLNAALRVEAVGFEPWSGCWLGVMVTPWSMNLVLLPRDPAHWHSAPRGDKRTYEFPAGRFEFIAGEDPIIGQYRSCSLFSPVLDFRDHATAHIVATLAKEALLDARHAPSREFEHAAHHEPRPVARLMGSLDAPISKRDLLHGRFGARDAE